MAISHIEELLSPEYVADLQALALSEVRSRRDECQLAADQLSYMRRLVQGRLDIVYAEVAGRSGGARGDLSQLVEHLPEILADGARPEGQGRLPTTFGPAAADGWIAAELDAVADARRLSTLPDLSDEDVRQLADTLSALERKVSSRRRRLFDVADAVQDEIVRRYKTGEANVDTLLRETP
jgi:hypothetical protein